MRSMVVTNNPKDWFLKIPNVEVVSAKAYLTDNQFTLMKDVRLFNLCKSYRYKSTGYYVSLLAEARGHKVFPDTPTIQDFVSQNIVRVISSDLESYIQTKLSKLKSKDFVLSIYFGKNMAKQYDDLCRKLYNLFPAPLLRVRFSFNKKWQLQAIYPISIKEIPEKHYEYAQIFASEYFSRKRFHRQKFKNAFYDLAILIDPEEPNPPSNKRAIQKFIQAAENLDINVEVITKDDFGRIFEFDALFIRVTTSVNHYSYRFSRHAFAGGLIVIDSPNSILRCSNKVYLAELLAKANIPMPKSLIVHKENRKKIGSELGFPCILKQPDSSFSQGIIKVQAQEELDQELDKMLADSDLIIAQEFTPTEFDWRIGVLDGNAIYACKYYMAKGHWQIYNWKSKKKSQQFGDDECFPIHEVPKKILDIAIRVANLIGDGLYGVDIKQNKDEITVIEINDNPSIDQGVEDAVLGDKLYELVMQSFISRLEKIRKKRSYPNATSF